MGEIMLNRYDALVAVDQGVKHACPWALKTARKTRHTQHNALYRGAIGVRRLYQWRHASSLRATACGIKKKVIL
jgi:hypothetical protein